MSQSQTVRYTFKTDATGLKRPTVDLTLPALGLEEIMEIIAAGGKGAELLLSTVNDVLSARTKELMNAAIEDTPELEVNQTWAESVIPQVNWDVIANLPPATRGTAGIAKETWNAFELDYVEVMQGLHPERPVERIKVAAKFLKAKFSSIKADKKAIALLQTFLGEWFGATSKSEDFAECFAAINSRAEELLNKEVSALDSIA